MQINSFKKAQEYIFSFIPKENSKLFPGELGLKRTKQLLSLLGNPQDSLKTIHIAGTSGKGSSAYLTSLLLLEHGFSVGLIVKPHILDIRERYLVNNTLISNTDFCRYVDMMVSVIGKVKQKEFGVPTYAEINAALAFLIFSEKKLDYAVIETYLGGTYDCTNVINRRDKLVVLTRIGFDHTKILGNTLAKIASQKAGIIHDGNPVIALWQLPQVRNIFNQAARKNNTKIWYIKQGEDFKNTGHSGDGIMFDFSTHVFGGGNAIDLTDLKLSMNGSFQAENASLALAAVSFLANRDIFRLSERNVRKAFTNAHFWGRMDVWTIDGKTVIIDSAHNPQKMRALLSSLSTLYPKKKFHFLIAFVEGKDSKAMLRYIIPHAERISVSTFFVENQDWIKKAQKPEKLEKFLDELGFHAHKSAYDISKAFNNAFQKADDVLVITGSQYFISELYRKIRKLKNEIKKFPKYVDPNRLS